MSEGAQTTLHEAIKELRELFDEKPSGVDLFESHLDAVIAAALRNVVPWAEGPARCTNCDEPVKPHPAYADFVGPFCEGCWDRLREYFMSGAICPLCKHEHDREATDCQRAAEPSR